MILTLNLDQYFNLTRETQQRQKKKKKKKNEDGVLSVNYEVIVIFLNYGQFGAIQKPDTRCMICKTYLTKTENRI